ncbi:sigma 54-interacting transcriptional regulator [Photobacterium sanguinicancri]|uniref:sigma 54-interacting transcriptional regulator n=1 Tax=Photobacterium sanguinicancri TaxID=875932 RepID=UPI003D0C9F87
MDSMQRTKNAPLIESISAKWDDDFQELAQVLLTATDIPSFILCLNRIEFHFVPINRINLILHESDDERSSLVYVSPKDKSEPKLVELSHCLPEHDDGNKEIVNYLSDGEFFSSYPSLVKNEIYKNLRMYCQFPLTTLTKHYGGVEFLIHNEITFDDNALEKLKQLSSIIAFALEAVVERAAFFSIEEDKSGNLDGNKILVDITNAVISQVEIKDLTRTLFKHLKKYFNVECFSLMSSENTTERFCCYDADKVESTNIKCIVQHTQFEDTPASCVLETMQPFIFNKDDIPDLSLSYKECGKLIPQTLQSACILPLIFRNKVMGAMKLVHRDKDYFQSCNLALFQQIAARSAMALANFQTSQEVMSLASVGDVIKLNDEEPKHEVFNDIISQSGIMNDVLQKVLMVADSDCTVLILGETGTGKELIAKAIHDLSHRSNKDMVKMNCSAVPSGLFESDLFGHEKGAFTGALSNRIGRFERANKGSLFLDEVGDMPIELQPKLLRVLQEKEVERIGRHQLIPVDVRLIAATNCDLLEMVQNKEFRSDLYYRLNVFPIVLPPLRERREDIPLLAKHFTRVIAKQMKRNITSIPAETVRLLSLLPWPGNIRELRNVIERAVVITRGNVLNLPADELKALLPKSDNFSESQEITEEIETLVERDDLSTVKNIEREHIIQVLKETNGIVAGPKGAAVRLGLKRTTLLSRMQRLGISSKSFTNNG